mmetsp:Transcript_85611/g.239084  ORF Transcript_85611/g.239084 Transcript_85611/m.239084 type:complete len:273 (+) Transcript_85611:202-1020(+)|eukprot:CAMPEP_0117502638 /NCGR_PEP_ID=MMETSP0784-20121206/23914_1 /TAXON_ID=39447 /ORGANISM="" /LENGTH=272 /DNA_ID=CAMNT_0005297923 /DNA_START=197 /DNA_END=1015 /DNA_ORIENTATION=-
MGCPSRRVQVRSEIRHHVEEEQEHVAQTNSEVYVLQPLSVEEEQQDNSGHLAKPRTRQGGLEQDARLLHGDKHGLEVYGEAHEEYHEAQLESSLDKQRNHRRVVREDPRDVVDRQHRREDRHHEEHRHAYDSKITDPPRQAAVAAAKGNSHLRHNSTAEAFDHHDVHPSKPVTGIEHRNLSFAKHFCQEADERHPPKIRDERQRRWSRKTAELAQLRFYVLVVVGEASRARGSTERGHKDISEVSPLLNSRGPTLHVVSETPTIHPNDEHNH